MTAKELKNCIELGGFTATAADITAGINLRERFREALQEIADEAVKHHEHNPVSGKDRLPAGYTKILNLADAALNWSNVKDEPRGGL